MELKIHLFSFVFSLVLRLTHKWGKILKTNPAFLTWISLARFAALATTLVLRSASTSFQSRVVTLTTIQPRSQPPTWFATLSLMLRKRASFQLRLTILTSHPPARCITLTTALRNRIFLTSQLPPVMKITTSQLPDQFVTLAMLKNRTSFHPHDRKERLR